MYQNIPFRKTPAGPPSFDAAAQNYADENTFDVPSRTMSSQKTGRTSQVQPPINPSMQRSPHRHQPLAVAAPVEPEAEIECQPSAIQPEVDRLKVEWALGSRFCIFFLVFSVAYLSGNEIPMGAYQYVRLLLNPFLVTLSSAAWFLVSFHRARGAVIGMRSGDRSIQDGLTALNKLANPFVFVASYLLVAALFGGENVSAL
jgi:hypothetical protein